MPSEIKLFNQDCVEAMKQMPDKAFDLAIVDPPYFSECKSECFAGSEISSTGIRRGAFRHKIKEWSVPDQEYFDELRRVSAHQIIWGINYYEAKFMGSGRIVWDKRNDGSSFSNCELAFCSMFKGVRIFRHRWNGMIQEGGVREIRIHPTQKPVALYRWLLKHYAPPMARILETHLGSGSIAIACYDMGLDLTGFEIDKDYFDAAVKRLENHKKQLTFI